MLLTSYQYNININIIIITLPDHHDVCDVAITSYRMILIPLIICMWNLNSKY